MHRELVPQGETVNVDFYCTVLRRLTEKFQLKKLELPVCAGSQRAMKTEEFVGCTNTIFTHNPDHQIAKFACLHLYPENKAETFPF